METAGQRLIPPTPKLAWRHTGILAVGSREGARFAKTNSDTDLRHRKRRPQQQLFGPVHSEGHMIVMWRHAKGIPEGTCKVIWAELG
jgi:hypothetical protein